MSKDFNKPLNSKPALRTETGKPLTQLTNNSNGWATVDGIAVPPDSSKRDFNTPLGQLPAFRDGMQPPQVVAPPAVVPTQAPAVSFNKPRKKRAPVAERPTAAPSFSYSAGTEQRSTFSINWYGAELAISVNSVTYQPPDYKRMIDGWLMLDLPLTNGTPSWLPPAANLNEEDAKIHIPSFTCNYSGTALMCEHLNIELWSQDRLYLVFRAIEVTND